MRWDGSRMRERVCWSWMTTSRTRAVHSTAMGAGVDVDGVAWDHDLDDRVGVGDDGLTAEARGGRQADGLVQQVLFVLLRRAKLIGPLLHHHVAGGAGADP